MTPIRGHVFLPGFWVDLVLVLRVRIGYGGEVLVREGVAGGKCGTRRGVGFMVVSGAGKNTNGIIAVIENIRKISFSHCRAAS